MTLDHSELKRTAINELLQSIYEATLSPAADIELAQIARWSGVPLDTVSEIGRSLVEQKHSYDIEAEEFSTMVEKYQRIEQIEDPGLRSWKLQALARRYKRPVAAITEAYNKALINQVAVQPLTVREFKALHEQDVAWLVPGWIPEATTLLLHADGGVGKTLFAYQLMECVLYAKHWNGYPVKQGSVLLVQCDEPSIVTNERIDLRGIGEDAPLKILSDWQVEGMSRLEKHIEADRPVLLIVDSLTTVNRNSIFSENDTEYARPLLELASMANRFGCTVVIIHHSNAEGGSRGTRAIYNSVSEVWALSQGQALNERLLRVQKTRLGRPPGRYKFLFEDEDFSFTYLGEDMGDDQASEQASTNEDKIRLWLYEDSQKGVRYSTAEISEYVGVTKHSARRSCYELWAKGLIHRVRPKGERAWLYFAGEGSIDPLSLNNSTCDQVITSDRTRAIGINARNDRGLDAMRSSDHSKTEIFTNANDENRRSLDHFPSKSRQGKEEEVIAQSDHLSDHLPLIDNASDHLPQIGDIVIANGSGYWLKTGSDKLPWQQVPTEKRSASKIPLSALAVDIFHELTEPSKVVSVSRNGNRVKVRNPRTGRTSVFGVSDVAIYQKTDRADQGSILKTK